MNNAAKLAIVGAAALAWWYWRGRPAQGAAVNIGNAAAGPRLPALPALPALPGLPAVSGAVPNMPAMPAMPAMPTMPAYWG